MTNISIINPSTAIRLLERVKRCFTPRHAVRLILAAILLLGTAYTASFYWPRAITFSYSNETCFANPTILPHTTKVENSASYAATPAKVVTFAGQPLYSLETCVTAVRPPKEKITEKILLAAPGNGLLKKQININSGLAPSLVNQTPSTKPIATQDPLIIEFTKADSIFEYRLLADTRILPCFKKERAVHCDVAKLNLAQSTQYTFTLERLFKDKPVATIFKRTLSTVEAIHVTSSSIAANQMIYDAPAHMTLQLSKSATVVKGAKLYTLTSAGRQEVPTTVTLDDKTIAVQFGSPLPRNASLQFEIEQITAPDGGFLSVLFTLPFKTSGGPKVLSTNIGSSRVQPTSSFVLRFDSDVSTSQALNSVIRLESGGHVLAASITASGRTISISPASALPRCAVFTITVLDGLQNTFGISGGTSWQYKSRTLCQSSFSIGTSVQGRSITAYSFGTGPSKVIFLGGTHGNEKSSVYTMNSWVEYLENNPDRIPANRTIIVIPNLNPDGFAMNQRTNANNVDLNRNFPSSDWKSGVTMPDKSYNATGGGAYALSEPESKALANYVLSQSPRLVLTYHATGAVVTPNDAGDSNPLALTYADKSSVYYLGSGETSSFFEYDITGSFEYWLYEKHSIPALLIELITMTNNESSGHQNALWYMTQLP